MSLACLSRLAVAVAAVPFALPVLLVFGSPRARAQGDWGVAYAPADARSTRPAIVFLHGMWASPEDSCEPFEAAATPFGFLVCPRGNARLRVPGDAGGWVDDDSDAGLKMWSGSAADAARSIHAALDAAEGLAPGRRARQGGTLIGFSNGAYFAAEVACAEPGRWTGLVLMSMKLDLDAGRLRQAGVSRVVFAAGDRDEARPSMQALAARLAASPASAGAGVGGAAGAGAGVGGAAGAEANALETRYMSLGDVGHTFPPDMEARMSEAIAWVQGAGRRR